VEPRRRDGAGRGAGGVQQFKIPLAVVVALAIFGEQANMLRLVLGGGVMVVAAALAVRRGG
jgi:hypothetical protein